MWDDSECEGLQPDTKYYRCKQLYVNVQPSTSSISQFIGLSNDRHRKLKTRKESVRFLEKKINET